MSFAILLPLIPVGSFYYFTRRLLQINTNFIWTARTAALASNPCCFCFYSPLLLGALKTFGEGANKYMGGICGPDSAIVIPVLPPPHLHCILLCYLQDPAESFFLWVLVPHYSKNKKTGNYL